MARRPLAAITPKSSAASFARSRNESTWARLASHTAPGRLPPTGGWSDHRSSDQTAEDAWPGADPTRLATRFAAPRRLGDDAGSRLTNDQRLFVRKGHHALLLVSA